MAYELIYTSVRNGLASGSSGFCVVACTKGMGPRLINLLEGLSAYRTVFPHYSEQAWENPVSRSHCISSVNGETQHILSRICFNGVDYTGRSNKLASHLVVSNSEALRAAGGPASLLLQEQLFKDASWQIETGYIMQQKAIPETTRSSIRCNAWERVCGDAGWGGFLAQSYLDNPGRNVYIVFDPLKHKNMIELIHEAINLLPERMRWQVSFSTFFETLPAGVNCVWRCCTADSKNLLAARRSPLNIIIDLEKPIPLTASGALIDAARSGKAPAEPELIKLADEPAAKPEKENVITLTPKLNIVPGSGSLPENSFRKKHEKRKLPPLLKWGGLAVLLLTVIFSAFAGFIYFEERAEQKKIATAKHKLAIGIGEKLARQEGVLSNLASRIPYEDGENLRKLFSELASCREALDAINKEIEALMPHQALFTPAQGESNPGKLKQRWSSLEKNIRYVENRINERFTELSKRSSRRAAAVETANAASSLPASAAAPSAPARRVKTPKPAAPLKPKAPPKPKTPPKPAEPREYLWEKAISGPSCKDGIRVFLGSDVKASDVKIELLDASDSGKSRGVYRVGELIPCSLNDVGLKPYLETRFDKGTLMIRSKNANVLPFRNDLLMIHVRKEKFPLFFVPGISRLRKPADDIKLECVIKGNSVRIIAPHLLPEQIYSIDGRRITTASPVVSVNGNVYPMKRIKPKDLTSEWYADVAVPELEEINRKESDLNMVQAMLKYYVCEFTGLLEKRFAEDDKKLAALDRFRAYSHKVLNFKNLSRVKRNLEFEFDTAPDYIAGRELKLDSKTNIGDYILVAYRENDSPIFTGDLKVWKELCRQMYNNSDELLALIWKHIPMSELARSWEHRLAEINEKSMLVFPAWMKQSSFTFHVEAERFRKNRNKTLKNYEKMKMELRFQIDGKTYSVFK